MAHACMCLEMLARAQDKFAYGTIQYIPLKNRRSEVFPLPEVLERLYWDDKNP